MVHNQSAYMHFYKHGQLNKLKIKCKKKKQPLSHNNIYIILFLQCWDFKINVQIYHWQREKGPKGHVIWLVSSLSQKLLYEMTFTISVHISFGWFIFLATVLMNTDALTVLGMLRVICSARRLLAWPQRFSETHPILRHERIRSMLSTSVCKVLLFPSTFCCAVCLLVLQKLVNTAVVLLWYQHALCDGTDMRNQLFQKDILFVDSSRTRR